jgi:hypothetical protein
MGSLGSVGDERRFRSGRKRRAMSMFNVQLRAKARDERAGMA